MNNPIRVTCVDATVEYDDDAQALTQTGDVVWVCYLKVPQDWIAGRDLQARVFGAAKRIYADWNRKLAADTTADNWSRYLLKGLQYRPLNSDETAQRPWQGSLCYVVDEAGAYTQVDWQNL